MYLWLKTGGSNGARGVNVEPGTRDRNQDHWGSGYDPSRGDEDLGVGTESGCDDGVGIVDLGSLVSGLGSGCRSGVSGVPGR